MMLPSRLLTLATAALTLLGAASPAAALGPQPVSTAAFEAGTVGGGDFASTSADGRYTVFTSVAVNLVSPVLSKPAQNVFVHDAVSNTVTLVSGINGGSTASGDDPIIFNAIISADGSTIAFFSSASDLKPGVVDDPFSYDLFVYHRPTASLELVTRVEGGEQAGGSFSGVQDTAVLSADGRYLAFTNSAGNLIAGATDENFSTDVFLYDRVTRGLSLVSAVEGSSTAAGGEAPAISADGSFIAFQSSATNLKAGISKGNFGADIYLYQRSSGGLSLVSAVNGSNTTGNGESRLPALSGDGRFVAFSSDASNLKAGVSDSNTATDVYVYDRLAPGLALASGIDGGNTSGNAHSGSFFGSSRPVAISTDGSAIAFVSNASNLKSGVTDNNSVEDVYLYNRTTPAITLVSGIDGGNTTASSFTGSGSVSITASGSHVAFSTNANNLKTGVTDTNGATDVFVYNRAAASLALVSGINGGNVTGRGANFAASEKAVISGDGRYVTYISGAKNLIDGDAVPTFAQVYRYTLGTPGQQRLTRHAAGKSGTMAAGNSLLERGARSLSADGRYLAFASDAVNLVSGQVDHNDAADIFLYDAVTGSTVLVSGVEGSSTTGNGLSYLPVISADGSHVAFLSQATNLNGSVTDGNGFYAEVYVYSRATGSVALVTGVNGGNVTANTFTDARTPVISGDGRYIAFVSEATNLMSDVTRSGFEADIYVHDRVARSTALVSGRNGGNVSGDGYMQNPVISGNGRFIAFETGAGDLDGNASDTGFSTGDIYVYDRVARRTSLVSGQDGGTQASPGSNGNTGISMSDDGSLIAFTSSGCDLVSGIPCGNGSNVFIHNRSTATTVLASGVDGGNTPGNFRAGDGALSGDGRYLAFLSDSSNLVTGVSDTNNGDDVYVFDRLTRRTVLASGIDGGTTASRTFSVDAFAPLVISADGGSVAFTSNATDLVSGMTSSSAENGFLTGNVFVFNRPASRLELLSSRDGDGRTAVGSSDAPGISADGSAIAFNNQATDLKTGVTDYNINRDIYRVALDRTPDAFSFADRSDVMRGAMVVSAPVTITGLSASAAVSVAGGQYSVNGGPFTVSPGGVVNGDTLQLRHTASAASGTATHTTVTVGGVSDTFTSTTVAGSGPNAFSFAARSNVAANVFITSEQLTITGYAGELPISVGEGGQYSVNGAAFTASSGMLASGSRLSVRHVSASGAGAAKETAVTVGDYSTVFRTVTTSLDRTPDAFSFGTKLGVTGGTLVESDTITLSGYNTSVAIQPGANIEYSLNGGTSWSKAAGSLAVGQSIKVRHTASTSRGVYTKTSLKIGGVTGTFTTRSK